MSFLGIVGIAICSAIVIGIVKQLNSGFSLYVGAACTIVLTYFALKYFQPLARLLNDFTLTQGMGDYVKTVVKLAAIGTVTSIASDICSDMGENAVASRIELVGKGAASMAVVPVLERLLYSVRDFLL